MIRAAEFYNRPERTPFLQLLYAGREKCDPGHTHIGVRDHYLLHVIVRGRGVAGSAGGRTDTLGPGDAFLFSPGQRLYYRADDKDPWDYRWIGFLNDSSRDLLRHQSSDQPLAIRSLDREGLQACFDKLIDALDKPDSGTHLLCEGYLYMIMGILVKARGTVSDMSEDSEYVAAAKRFMYRNYQRDINVATVTRHIGLDRSYFSSLFHAETGRTLRDFLIDLRMEVAQRLLRETNLSVREVAVSIGYPDYPAFARRFNERTGMSARKWRENPDAESPQRQFRTAFDSTESGGLFP